MTAFPFPEQALRFAEYLPGVYLTLAVVAALPPLAALLRTGDSYQAGHFFMAGGTAILFLLGGAALGAGLWGPALLLPAFGLPALAFAAVSYARAGFERDNAKEREKQP